MKTELTDTQNERDDRRVPIDRVGVKGLRFPVQIRDKAGRVQSSVAKIALAVDLPHHVKGTHMSRFVEALHDDGEILDICSVARIPSDMLKRLDATCAHAVFEFPYFIEKSAPVTGRKGVMDYEIKWDVSCYKSGEVDLLVEIKVPVATLCPCSKAISDYGAHNQRGEVTYSVRFSAEPMWMEDLIVLVEESASCALYSVLKRPDEKFVTERAYDNPVFVEDLVRNVAVRSQQTSGLKWFRVEAENFESIHHHNAYALIEQELV